MTYEGIIWRNYKIYGFDLPSESLCHISLTVFNSKLVKVNFKFYVGKKEKKRKIIYI